MKQSIFGLFAALALAVPAARAQQTAGSDMPSFDAASIHASRCNGALGPQLAPSGRLDISCLTLAGLTQIAYFRSAAEGETTGGPKWADLDRFDVIAEVDRASIAGWDTMSSNQRFDAVRPLIQQLLAERFQLRIHAESRAAAVFALVQAKGGARLKEVPQPSSNGGRKNSDEPPPGLPTAGTFRISEDHWTANAVQIRNILFQIAARTGYTGSPMIDETGLTGFYTFDMKLPDDKDGATFEQALINQLGLLVRSDKVPRTTCIIDSAIKPELDSSQ